LDGSHLTKPAFKNNDTDSVVYTRLLAFTHKVSESILTGMKISIVSYDFQEQLQKKNEQKQYRNILEEDMHQPTIQKH